VLTPANVNVSQFGKIYSGAVNLDSWAPLSPLRAQCHDRGTTHNVVYVATLNNSVYAFDADSGLELWTATTGRQPLRRSLHRLQLPGRNHPRCRHRQYSGHRFGCGILYFVTKNGDGSPSKPFALNLHAVDFTTGIEETSLGSPVTILPPTGPTFLPQYQMNRPGLLLNNGSSMSDWDRPDARV